MPGIFLCVQLVREFWRESAKCASAIGKIPARCLETFSWSFIGAKNSGRYRFADIAPSSTHSQLQPVTIVRFNILGWQREVSTCWKPICFVDDVGECRRNKPESVRLRAVTFLLPDVTKRLPSSLLSPALI